MSYPSARAINPAFIAHWEPFFSKNLALDLETMQQLYEIENYQAARNATILLRELVLKGLIDDKSTECVARIVKYIGKPGLARMLPGGSIPTLFLPKEAPPAPVATGSSETDHIFAALRLVAGTPCRSGDELVARWTPLFRSVLGPSDLVSIVQLKRLHVAGTALPSLVVRTLFEEGHVSLDSSQFESIANLLLDMGRAELAAKLLGQVVVVVPPVPPAASFVAPNIPANYNDPCTASHLIPDAELCYVCLDQPNVVVGNCGHYTCASCHRDLVEKAKPAAPKCGLCNTTPTHYTFLRDKEFEVKK
jgi:hypothetical protein